MPELKPDERDENRVGCDEPWLWPWLWLELCVVRLL
jgi:hypothetical protein